MADSTKINQLQEKLLEANSIITNKIIEGISFDRTITCNIIDDTYKKEGKYIVSNGAQEFTAYSTVTNYSVNNTVYVTIPNGDYANQKIIIGKKTSNEDKPFVFTTPFDTMVDLTGNTISSLNWSALANEKDVRVKDGNTASFKKLSLASYTRLGISANFQTWIGEAVTGNYGLKFILHTRTQNTVDITKTETDEDYYKYSDYDIYLQVSDMYGNPYNFESYYNQQKVIDITDCGEIIGIDVELFQDGNFVDSLGTAVPSTDGIDMRLFDNIFVKDIYICAGNDISEFDTDYVKLYTTSKTTYTKEERTTNETIPKRELELRWVHLFDGNPKQIKELDSNSEIHWYRYRVGAAAADDYCGVYWEGIENDGENPFKLQVKLNTEQQQEKFKAIAFYNNVPYRSNEVIFDNEEIVPSQETIIKQNALAIEADDDTDGNYLFYSQNGRLIESQDSNKTRGLYLSFDPTGTNRTNLNPEDYDNVKWTLPKNNTMFRWLDVSTLEEDSNNKYVGKIKRTDSDKNLPQYKIATNYQAGNNDNIITAEYTVEGRTYKAVKEFTFGKFGTMGSLQTLEVDWVNPNVTAIKVTGSYAEEIQEYKVQVKVYDKDGKVKSNIGGITWDWYDWHEGVVKDKSPKYIQIVQDEQDSTILKLNPQSGLKHNYLYILKVKVGDLETYFSIPLYSGNCTHIEGSKEIYYQANGIPEQYKTPYQIYNGNEELLNTNYDIVWSVISTDTIQKNKGQYDPIIENKKLKVIQTYVENAPLYGVSCVVTKGKDTYAQWTQPILVIKNTYPSGVINKWDGKSIQMNNEDGTILATAIAAGSKNSDNQFSGVMIGDWSGTKKESDGTEESISGQTGVYGLHEGSISYAFMDDGTAFIGKNGKGRINFNGDNSTIYSAQYKEKNNPYGMMIDLGGSSVPYIDMKYGSSNQITLGIDTTSYSPYLHMSANVSKSRYPLAIGSKFRVEWSGKIHATDGEFSGTIYADNGTIGGWEITDTQLKNSRGTVILDSTGLISGATITGSSISGGTITGATITSETIYISNNEGNIIYYYNKYKKRENSYTYDYIETVAYNNYKGYRYDDGEYSYIFDHQSSSATLAYFGRFTGSDGSVNSTALVGIKSTTLPVVVESTGRIRISSSSTVYIDAKEITITGNAGSNPENQHGIYARFA